MNVNTIYLLLDSKNLKNFYQVFTVNMLVKTNIMETGQLLYSVSFSLSHAYTSFQFSPWDSGRTERSWSLKSHVKTMNHHSTRRQIINGLFCLFLDFSP